VPQLGQGHRAHAIIIEIERQSDSILFGNMQSVHEARNFHSAETAAHP
jgi:hypothetical protein